MTDNNKWMKYLTESVVIVGSILLAFAIDAWWDARLENQAEQELLKNILSISRQSRTMILDATARTEANQERLRFFYNSPVAELSSVPLQSAMQIVTPLWQPATIELMPLMQTADVNLIKNEQVRELLGRWINTAQELLQFNQQIEALSNEALVFLGHHTVFQQFRINGIESLEQELDLRSMRNDEELKAVVVAKLNLQTAVHLVIFPSLDSTSSQLEQLVAPLIK